MPTGTLIHSIHLTIINMQDVLQALFDAMILQCDLRYHCNMRAPLKADLMLICLINITIIHVPQNCLLHVYISAIRVINLPKRSTV